MNPHRALPFVLRRESGSVTGMSVTSTRDDLHGILRIEEESLVVQWRTARETSHVGSRISTERELTPIREVVIPLTAVSEARVRRAWRAAWTRRDLVLTAADLRAFDALTGVGGVDGLLLEHPAEVVLRLRRTDRALAHDFVAGLRLAVSERLLRELSDEADREAGRALSERALPEADDLSLEALMPESGGALPDADAIRLDAPRAAGGAGEGAPRAAETPDVGAPRAAETPDVDAPRAADPPSRV